MLRTPRYIGTGYGRCCHPLVIIIFVLWVSFVTLILVFRPTTTKYLNAPIFRGDGDEESTTKHEWDDSKYPLILLDFSGIELSYLTPLGVLDHTIRQGATFHYKGLILENIQPELYSDFLKDLSGTLLPNVTLHVNAGAFTLNFPNNAEHQTKVVGDFNVRMELVRPSSTLYPKSHNLSLQWINTILSPKLIQITNTTTIMESLLKEYPNMQGYPIAKQTLDMRFFGEDGRNSKDDTLLSASCFYKIVYPFLSNRKHLKDGDIVRNIAQISLAIDGTFAQKSRSTSIFGANSVYNSNSYFGLRYLGPLYMVVMATNDGAPTTVKIGSMHLVESTKYNSLFSSFEKYSKTGQELNDIFGLHDN